MSLLFLPLTFRRSFVRSFVTSCGGFVAAVASPLSFVQLLCVWCKVFCLFFYVYFLFYFICLIASLVVQMFGAGAIRDGRVSSLK